MELLTIEHDDFTLIVECPKFDCIWNKASRNIGEENLLTSYSWSSGVESVKLSSDNGRDINVEQGANVPAFFFENTDYPIWTEFYQKILSACPCATLIL